METEVKVFEVGGSIRDSYLGIPNDDVDYTVEVESFDRLRDYIVSIGGDIKVETPEFVTIKAVINHVGTDFVICRRDGVYKDGRRPDDVEIGTIEDDLARRDFTMNAIAKNSATGEIIDIFGGYADMDRRLIRCVGNAFDRIDEDPLRLLRAIRFSITKGFDIHWEIGVMINQEWITRIRDTVSEDRIREEVFKMFKYDTVASFNMIIKYPCIVDLFEDGIWMKATSKSK